MPCYRLMPSTHALIYGYCSLGFHKQHRGDAGLFPIRQMRKTGSGSLSDLLKAPQSPGLESRPERPLPFPAHSLAAGWTGHFGLPKVISWSSASGHPTWLRRRGARPESPTSSPPPRESATAFGGQFTSSHSRHTRPLDVNVPAGGHGLVPV